MKQQDLRTYRRRETTRVSGHHTIDNSTGSECLIEYADQYKCSRNIEEFSFKRETLRLIPVFGEPMSLIAFGGFIHTKEKAKVTFSIEYSHNGKNILKSMDTFSKTIESNTWQNIGFHVEEKIGSSSIINNAIVHMKVESSSKNILNFISFDFDVVSKKEYLNDTLKKPFYQKTKMHIPYLYYLETLLPTDKYLIGNYSFSKGKRMILKSCNRCGRYLPINIEDEMKTLCFSLHCKKKAPCKHSTFRSYKIENVGEVDTTGLNIEDGRVVSYYGHQLECKACKKFFVNAPLNPQRNAQQFKEDGLRRRAIEVLVDNLLEKNLVHNDFRRKNKKEFSEYIWEKFDKRCFKCGPNSKQIGLDEMNLDHTMPLAYLYRLDETATCLCKIHNSQKSDSFPVDFYSEEELERLSKITGLPLATLKSRKINEKVLHLLKENVVWYFDEFLTRSDYTKIRDGIKTADKINDSLKRVIKGEVDLAEEYKNIKGYYPKSVTIK